MMGLPRPRLWRGVVSDQSATAAKLHVPNLTDPITQYIKIMKTKKTTEKYTAKQKKEAGKILSSLGGRATYKKIGKEGMSAIGKKGAKKRWAL